MQVVPTAFSLSLKKQKNPTTDPWDLLLCSHHWLPALHSTLLHSISGAHKQQQPRCPDTTHTRLPQHLPISLSAYPCSPASTTDITCLPIFPSSHLHSLEYLWHPQPPALLALNSYPILLNNLHGPEITMGLQLL